jgi:hypothetical protein
MEIKTNFYTLIPYSNLLYIESFLAWDERVAMDFAKDINNLALHHYQEKPWAIFSDGTHWKLPTPECRRVLTQRVNTEITQTITHYAYVTGHSEIKKWLFENAFKTVTTYTAKIFVDHEDAEAWLASFGYRRTIQNTEK